MHSPEEPGILLSATRRVGLALSLIALLTFGWNATRYVLAQDMTLKAHSEYIEADKLEKKEIVDQLKQLNSTVDILVTIAKESRGEPIFGSTRK